MDPRPEPLDAADGAVAAHDHDVLSAVALEVLGRAGGPLAEGYRQGARLPQ